MPEIEDVYDRIVEDKGDILPIGTVRPLANDVIPDGWLECNGASLSAGAYPDLFNIIGYRFGGIGANFNIPDLRGRFIRGYDHGAGRDNDINSPRTAMAAGGSTGDNIGSIQAFNGPGHDHDNDGGSHSGGQDGSATLTNYTRNYPKFHPLAQQNPDNIYCMYIIKY